MAENKNILSSQLIDLGGLSTFWGKAKEYVDGLNTVMGGRVDALGGDVEGLKTVLNGDGTDNNKGLVDAVATLRTEVDALGGVEGGIQGMIDATIADLNLDNRFTGVDNAAKGYAGDAETNAKAYADTKASAAEAAAKAYTDAHISATYNVPGSDPVTTASIHLIAGERENWNKAKSDIDAFLAQAGFDKEGKNVVDTLKELQEYINTHGTEAAGLLEEINKLKAADEKLSATDATNLATAKTYAKAYADTLVYEVDNTSGSDKPTVTPRFDAKGAANTAESNAKGYADDVAATAESNAKGYAKDYTDEQLASIQIASDTDIINALFPTVNA